MQTIQPVRIEDVDDPTRRLLETANARYRDVSTMLTTMAQSPATLEGYLYFVRALEDTGLDPRLSEQIALIVAQADKCDYSLTLHIARVRDLGLEEDEILATREGRVANRKTEAALRFARSLAQREGDYTVTDLRRAGYSDGDIVNIIACVGLNSFANLFNMIAKTHIDVVHKQGAGVKAA
jgi:AhpD family alkylhydroperoxidase